MIEWKQIGLALAGLTLLLAASVGASCNFASEQAQKTLVVKPDGSVVTEIGFFNIHGDRIIHVNLAVSKAPAGFAVVIDPPSREQTYDISGLQKSITENLGVEITPMNLLPAVKPDDSEWIKWAKLREDTGFIPLNLVKIRVFAPSNAVVWSESDLVVSGTGACFDVDSASGNATTLVQQRDFVYKVKVVPKNYTETLVVAIAPSPSPSPAPVVAGIAIKASDWGLKEVFLSGVVLVVALIAAWFSWAWWKQRKTNKIVFEASQFKPAGGQNQG